jgi:glycine dehydrogenase subunit 1
MTDSPKKQFVHPYIPNSVPEVKTRMLQDIGVQDIEDLYADIPETLRFNKDSMGLPDPLPSEHALKRHVQAILAQNRTCADNISFLGGGCARHYVPAICDEINHRSEFLTAYAGEPYEDHGRFQALFEYQSLMGELLDMDVVNVPTYDWGQAASTAIRMAGRLTGRREMLVSRWVSPDRLAVIRNYCQPVMALRFVRHDPETGQLDMEDLEQNLTKDTAGLYLENPAYTGHLEDRCQEIADRLHTHEALFLVGVDPTSLGVIVPPSRYGADIVCGDIQGLGMHLSYGGGLAGFIATHDDPRFVMEYPSRLFGITRTRVLGEHGFGDVAYERTSFDGREKGKEFVGTHAALWGITAAVYLSLMGPQGMRELGQVILQRSQYLMQRLSRLPGVRAPRFRSPHFKEFVVDFSRTGKTTAQINTELLARGIFGGHDLSREFPDWGETALYCVTEMHNRSDLDALVESLSGILGSEVDR